MSELISELTTSKNLQEDLNRQVREFLSLDQEDRNNRFQSKEFLIIFPNLVKRMLSPDGLKEFSSESRGEIFATSLTRFSTSFSYPGGVIMSEVRDSLQRSADASIVLLGMSMPDEEQAMRNIVGLYKELNKKRPSFRQSLGLLLAKSSATRAWIKTNQLDLATGYEWDTQLAELILNLPENSINPSRNLPHELPGIMGGSLSRIYSTQATDIFLDYALEYANNMVMTRDRMDSIQDFINAVRRFPKEFVMKPSTQAGLMQLRQIIEKADFQHAPTLGNVPSARELLPNPPRTLALRWFSPQVKKLVG